MATRRESVIQEDLVALYLRLNGYFVSSFIAHSPDHGRNRAEMDAIAVRFPFSCEPERMVGTDAPLGTSTDKVELLLCEVKSRGQKIRFNQSITKEPEALESALRWSGVVASQSIPEIARSLSASMQAGIPDGPTTVIVNNQLQIRAIVFCPENQGRRPNQPWYIDGSAILQYAWRCFCPTERRAQCATTYDLTAWGRYEPLVSYFKARGKDGPGVIEDIYKNVAARAA